MADSPAPADDAAGPEDQPPRSFAAKVGSLGKELLIVVVGALVIAALIRAFAGEMFLVPSGSMLNTLQIGDRIAVQKITDFKRGDVVVFKDPDNWLGGEESAPPPGPIRKALEFIGVLPNTSNQYLVKRAIGMPGDHVVCCDRKGRITVNGKPLNESSYLYSSGGRRSKPSQTPFDVVVPADRIWVLGDHRDNSCDSRYHLGDPSPAGKYMNAFVPIDDVVGPVFAIVSPLSDATWESQPDTFKNVPDPSGRPPATATVKAPMQSCG
jgi:signal peptidase I